MLLASVMLLPLPLAAQDQQTLADIRQELTVLHVEIQRLKRELSTTGTPSAAVTGNSVLDRVGAIETELERLTLQTEELGHRIDRIVSDGTNRIGDLEFRLVELEGGDLGALGETTTLGGGKLPAAGGRRLRRLKAVPRPVPEPGAVSWQLASRRILMPPKNC